MGNFGNYQGNDFLNFYAVIFNLLLGIGLVVLIHKPLYAAGNFMRDFQITIGSLYCL